MAALVVPAGPAGAMLVPEQVTAAGTIQTIDYAFAANFNTMWGATGRDTFKAALNRWQQQGANAYVAFREQLPFDCYVELQTAAPPTGGAWGSNELARATRPCRDGSGGYLVFNQNQGPWHTQQSSPPSGWIDMYTVAVHEIGHWLGLSHSEDQPSSDNNTPVMYPLGSLGTSRRIPRQDDHNGLHIARPRYKIMTHNDSFETTSPAWGWITPNGGTATRVNGTAYNGSYYMELSPNPTSIAQDIYNRGYLQNSTLRGRVWARAPSGTRTVTIAVWALGHGLLAQSSCSVGTSWTMCETAAFSTGDRPLLRIEAYNGGSGNIHVDSLFIRW